MPYSQKSKQEARAFMNALASSTVCAHCGAQPVDWHNPEHVALNRRNFRIGRMVQLGFPVTAIKAELERCTPLCRRCHMKEDGRLKTFHVVPKPGESNPSAKLSTASVVHMRHLHSEGVAPSDLATQFGISLVQTHNIVKRRAWKHLP